MDKDLHRELSPGSGEGSAEGGGLLRAELLRAWLSQCSESSTEDWTEENKDRQWTGATGRRKLEPEAAGEPSHEHSSRVPWWGPQGSLEDAGLRSQRGLCTARLRAPGAARARSMTQRCPPGRTCGYGNHSLAHYWATRQILLPWQTPKDPSHLECDSGLHDEGFPFLLFILGCLRGVHARM